jgi:TetR/AcrR family transcriptional repressor of nem operon
MRYKKEHKAETHGRIVAVANRRFRERGFTDATIPEVMGEAGLTHGGFYAHFASKDALIEESIEKAFRDSIAVLFAKLDGLDAATRWEKVVRRYLNERHRDSLAEGCLMPALSGEVARMDPSRRQRYEKGLKEFLEAMRRHVPDDGASPTDGRTIALLALMVGGVLLSRAVADKAFSDRILDACRAFALTDPPAPQPKSS